MKHLVSLKRPGGSVPLALLGTRPPLPPCTSCSTAHSARHGSAQVVRRLLDVSPLSADSRRFCAAVLVDTGTARKAAGATQEALALYTEALSVEPRFHLALFHVGVLAFESGRRADAQALYERAVAADPTNIQARLLLCVACRCMPVGTCCCDELANAWPDR